MPKQARTVLWRIEHHDLGQQVRNGVKVLVAEWRLTPYIATGKRVRPANFAKDKMLPIVKEATVIKVLSDLSSDACGFRANATRRVLADAVMGAFMDERHGSYYERVPSKPQSKSRREMEQRCMELEEEIASLKGCRTAALQLQEENTRLRRVIPVDVMSELETEGILARADVLDAEQARRTARWKELTKKP